VENESVSGVDPVLGDVGLANRHPEHRGGETEGRHEVLGDCKHSIAQHSTE